MCIRDRIKEEEQTEAYFDLLLLQIKQLTKQIEYNFSQSEKECSMINSFVLHKNAQLQEKIRWLEMKLEAFIKEKNCLLYTSPFSAVRIHKESFAISTASSFISTP